MASSSNSGSLVAPLPDANANIPPLAAAMDPMEEVRGGRAAIVAVASAGWALLVMVQVLRGDFCWEASLASSCERACEPSYKWYPLPTSRPN